MNKITISGKQLKLLLKAEGYSVKDIADAIGVTTQNLYAAFNSNAVQRKTLQKIAAAIGKDMAFFLEAENLSYEFLSGADLKKKIQRENISIPWIAAQMGTSAQSLYSIFKSKNIRSATVDSLAEAMGKPRDWFYSFNAPRNIEDRETLIKAQAELIDRQNKYIQLLEEKLSLLEKK